MALRLPLRTLRLAGVRYMASGMGDFGTGAGKGLCDFQGGTGGAGAVKESGGAFSRMEAAHEEMYFKKLQAIQLQRIKEHLEDEVDHHEKAIREHQDEVVKKHSAKGNEQLVEVHEKTIKHLKEAIERHKKKIQKLHHQEKDIADE